MSYERQTDATTTRRGRSSSNRGMVLVALGLALVTAIIVGAVAVLYSPVASDTRSGNARVVPTATPTTNVQVVTGTTTTTTTQLATISPTPQSKVYLVPHLGYQASHMIVTGKDGNLWFAENIDAVNNKVVTHTDKIAMLTPSGTLTEYTLPPATDVSRTQVYGLTLGPDGNIWYARRDRIGVLMPDGIIKEFVIGSLGIFAIASGPDGDIWYGGQGTLGKMTPGGFVTYFGGNLSFIHGLVAGPDGNMWATQDNTTLRITPEGKLTEYHYPKPGSSSYIVVGKGNTLWFAGLAYTVTLGQITTDGTLNFIDLTKDFTAISSVIAAAPDGTLWFSTNKGMAKYTSSGVVKVYPWFGSAQDLIVGPDGNLWYIDGRSQVIGTILINT